MLIFLRLFSRDAAKLNFDGIETSENWYFPQIAFLFFSSAGQFDIIAPIFLKTDVKKVPDELATTSENVRKEVNAKNTHVIGRTLLEIILYFPT